MEKIEQYQKAQDEFVKLFDIKEGSQVTVSRIADDYEMGWDLPWTSRMNDLVGKTYKVQHISTVSNGIRISLGHGDNAYIPFFIISKVIDRLTIPLESGDYEVEIDKSGKFMTVGCQEVSFSKVEEIYAKMKSLQ